jgi:AraC-like DNA-binding protein
LALPCLLPGTGSEIYFHFGAALRYRDGAGSSALGRSHLLCLRNTTLPLEAAEQFEFIAVRIRSGMLQRLTRVPVAALADQICNATVLWGKAGEQLEHQLAGAAGTQERIALLEHFFLERLAEQRGDALMEALAQKLYYQADRLTIEELAGQAHLGRRQLEKRFSQATGFRPVELRGLVRLQRTVRHLLLHPEEDTLATALANGYYDQAHFIRDFRRRSGQTPAQYLQAARKKTHFYNSPL